MNEEIAVKCTKKKLRNKTKTGQRILFADNRGKKLLRQEDKLNELQESTS